MFTDPTQGCQIQFQWGDPKFQWPGHVPPSLLANTTLRTAAAIPETDRQQSDTNIHTHTKADLTREQELNVHIVHHVSLTNGQQIYSAFYHSTPLHYLVHHPPSNILYWRYYSLPNIFLQGCINTVYQNTTVQYKYNTPYSDYCEVFFWLTEKVRSCWSWQQSECCRSVQQKRNLSTQHRVDDRCLQRLWSADWYKSIFSFPLYTLVPNLRVN